MVNKKKLSAKKKPEKCKKILVTKYRVRINKQYRDFDDQELARKWALEVLQAPIYFLEMINVEVEKKDC